MTHIIAIANQKGGVGKTTSCVNLAASLVATRRRVLLIDLDPQGNSTMGSGVNKHKLEACMTDVLLDDVPFADVTLLTESARYHLAPANGDLTAAEIGLLQMPKRQFRLRKALQPVENNYDYILIDCPPAINMLTLNALTAAKSVIIPMQCEYFALEGLSALLDTIDQIKQTVNPDLQVDGILRTMYDGRNLLAKDVSAQLHEHFGDKVYRTVIPRNVRLAEAPSHGLAVLQYDKRSQGAAAYLALAGELLRRNEQRELSVSTLSEEKE